MILIKNKNLVLNSEQILAVLVFLAAAAVFIFFVGIEKAFAAPAPTCPSGVTVFVPDLNPPGQGVEDEGGTLVCDNYDPPKPYDANNFDWSMCPTMAPQPGVVPSPETCAYNNAAAAAANIAAAFNTENAGSGIVAQGGELCFTTDCMGELNGGSNIPGAPAYNYSFSRFSAIVNFTNTNNGQHSCAVTTALSLTTGWGGTSFSFSDLDTLYSGSCTPTADLASYGNPSAQTSQYCQVNGSGQNTGYQCAQYGLNPENCTTYNPAACPANNVVVCDGDGVCEAGSGENVQNCPADCASVPDFSVSISPVSATTTAGSTKSFTVTISPVAGTVDPGPIYFELYCSTGFLGPVLNPPTVSNCSFTGNYSTDPDASGQTFTTVGNALNLSVSTSPGSSGGAIGIIFNGYVYDDAHSASPIATISRNASAVLNVIGPNTAICDGAWRQIPGVTNSVGQPVGKNLDLANSLFVLMRDSSNNPYVRYCKDNNFTCEWTNSSYLLPGGKTTLTSPFANANLSLFGAYLRDPSGAKTWHNAGPQDPTWATWDTSWDDYGSTDYDWGKPFRFTDVSSRNWQLKRNSDNSVSYACGLNVCVNLSFNSSNSSVNGSNDATVNVGDNVNVVCDYNARTDAIDFPQFTGAQGCSFNGWTTGTTKANFSCQASQATNSTPVFCRTHLTSDNVCASVNAAGYLTVVGSVCTPGATQPCGSGTCGGTQTCNASGTGWGSCSTDSNTCNSGSACTTNETCLNGSCQGGDPVAGTHGVCSGNACVQVPNTASTCTDSCASNSDCSGGPAPSISLNPTTFTFNATSGEPAPANQNLTISNPSSGTTLNWRAQTNQDWCRVNGVNNSGSITGTATNGSPATVVVSVDAPSNVGTFNCTVTVSDNGSSPAVSNSPQTASVTYTVTSGTPNDPGTGPSCNSGNPAACQPYGGADPVCGEVKLTWTDASTNETGFKVYKDGVYVATVNSTTTSATGARYSYNYSVGSDNTLHTYSVSATNGSADSSQTPLASVAGFSCQANLSTRSDKDITAINSTSVTANPCNGQSNLLPPTLQLKSTDTASFSINLCNTGPTPATKIYVTDYLTNLSNITNVRFCNGGVCNAIPSGLISFAGSAPNQTMSLNLTGSSYDIPAGSSATPAVRSITFTATLDPGATSAAYSRFQNTGTICYAPLAGDSGSCHGNSGTASVGTPLLLFSVGNGDTVRREIGP